MIPESIMAGISLLSGVHMKMPSISFAFVFLATLSVLWAQESPDAVTGASEGAAPAGPSGLGFHFYGDFDIETAAAGDFSGKPTFTFKQNHQALLIQAPGNQEISVFADIFHPNDLFELGLTFGGHRLTLGRILIPFGEFGIHHLYGGRQDDEGIFLPKLWSDYGLSLKSPLGEMLALELYAVNGFDPAGFVSAAAAPRFHAVGSVDSGLAKAVGARLRFEPVSDFWTSASLYQDFYADDPDRSVTLAGVDSGIRIGSLGLKAGIVVSAIRGPEFDDFFRWADYAEIKYDFTEALAVRARAGSMDGDTRVSNGEDQNNVNIGLLWNTGYVEYDLVYFRNLSGNAFADDPVVSDKHQVLLKVLFSL